MKLSYHTAVILSVLFPIWGLTACKKTETSEPQPAHNSENSEPEAEEKVSITLDEAVQIIKQQKNLTIIEIKDGRIYMQNKYNKLKLDLSPQDVLGKKYELLALDGPEYLEKNTLTSNPAATWGKSPEWIPRYPKAELLPNAMHAPLKDGSIWGNINFLHSDSMDQVIKYLEKQFKAQKMIVATNVQQKNSHILVFQTQKEAEQKRRVTATIRKHQNKTKVSLQYSYGMP